jgi:hypothetical protein
MTITLPVPQDLIVAAMAGVSSIDYKKRLELAQPITWEILVARS